MSYSEWDAMEDAYGDYMENLPKEWQDDAIRGFLGMYGDSIDDRLNRLQKTSEQLIKDRVYDFALVATSTGLEITIKYFCVKPLVEGAFLSELWASELAKRIVDTRIAENRSLFVTILKHWGINIEAIEISVGKKLWGTITNEVLNNRNKVIHLGAPMNKEDAEVALQCFVVMRKTVVAEIADRFGFSYEKTGCWHKILKTAPLHVETGWNPKDIFNL